MEYRRARTLEEAVRWLNESGIRSRILGGGTDLMLKLRAGELATDRLVDLHDVPGWDRIEVDGETITLGPGVSFARLLASAVIRAKAPLLAQMAVGAGAVQLRNMGTLGGNICNAALAADSIPALMALDAEVELLGPQGVRRLPLADLIEGPGRTGLQPGEILTALRFAAPGGRSLFIKVGRRNALNISRLSISAAGRLDEAGRIADVRLVAGAAIPRTRRITEVESGLLGQRPSTAIFEEAGARMAAVMVAEAGRRWSTPYKEPVLAALTRRALAQVFEIEPAVELPEFLADLHLPVQHPGVVHPPDPETRVHPRVRHDGSPQPVHFQLNGEAVTASVPVGLSLLTVLRETFGLLGVKVGCNGGECGACTVLLDGEPVLACLMLAHQAEGRAVVTVEGLQGPDGELSDLQQAFIDHGAVQCGFCIPGMLLSAEALLERDLEPDREEIRYAIAGNLCRCTGYQQIVDAIEATAQERRKNLS